ncbi:MULTISPECIES: hypothetical protein [unclassified Paenibacillus]|uniref:hypothetical protein n=1 Tax=unclassified Paenibacillus TaxID=185978 RepID=UPI0009FA452B|nr:MULTISPECIES: hypothetical protein [unclassified Paenibacillus]
MLSSKYFVYLFVLNGLINIINFVPRTLIDHRFGGALMSIFVAIVVGTVMLYVVTGTILKIPGVGLPELYTRVFPAWLKNALLGVNMAFWCAGGVITLLSFVDITQRFISPDVPQYLILTGFLVMVCGAALTSSRTVLFALEAILLLSLPMVIYFFIKSLLSSQFGWDAVISMFTHVWNRPNFTSVSGAVFIFTGYESIILLNRVLKPLPLRHLWMFPIFSFGVLLTTFLIPIAYHGTIGVAKHSYPWFTTADSIHIEFFVVERVLFVFYLMYLMMSLMNAIINWHVGVEMFKSFTHARSKRFGPERAGVVIVVLFAAATVWLKQLNEISFQQAGIYFLQLRFLAEFFYIAIFLYAVRRYNQLCKKQRSL